MQYYNTVTGSSKLKRYAPWLIVAAAILWGVEAPLRKYLTTNLSSGMIVLTEHIIISIFAIPLLALHLGEVKRLNLKGWISLLLVALGGSALATMFYTESFRYVNPSVSILLQKTQPFIALMLAFVVLRERLVRTFYLWASIAIMGAYFVSFPELKPRGFSLSGPNLGVLFALMASCSWAASTVFGKYLLFTINFQSMTCLRFLFALVFLFLINVSMTGLREFRLLTGKDMLFLFILAIIVGFVAVLFYYRGLSDTKASVSTIAELAYPLSGVIINWKFLGAPLRPLQLVGGGLLLLAISQVSRLTMQSITPEGQKS